MKKLVIITNANYPTWALKVDKKRWNYIENKINQAYNHYYGNDELYNEYRGFYEYITTILNRIKGVELLEFDTIELDPHW